MKNIVNELRIRNKPLILIKNQAYSSKLLPPIGGVLLPQSVLFTDFNLFSNLAEA